jgi:hypothetical protein
MYKTEVVAVNPFAPVFVQLLVNSCLHVILLKQGLSSVIEITVELFHGKHGLCSGDKGLIHK